MRIRRRHHAKEVAELNITAFMNLMVILVPFLLVTAVFSRMTVIELNLPAKDAQIQKEEKVKLELELVVRQSSFDVQDRRLGLIKRFERSEEVTDWNAFSELLVEIKSRFPEEQNITLLLERNIEYQTLVQVMDRVRSADVVNIATLDTVELFPNIAIGDAQTLSAAEAGIAK
ncbi:MAG: biopolymer transporter ExbD [Gammaproteobacteria bacterium]|nr:biopolymer transporter ExbD [Gammaproteobacteria bacterium]